MRSTNKGLDFRAQARYSLALVGQRALAQKIMLSTIVTSYLKKRIPDKIEEVTPREERSPFIRIRATETDFGDIELYDDGDEVTISFGRFTHSHFSNYDDIPLKEKEIRIAEDVYDVLQATLNDDLEFWGSHQRSGGFQRVNDGQNQKQSLASRLFSRRGLKTFYRWSGATKTIKS